jgi:hypothetical protein
MLIFAYNKKIRDMLSHKTTVHERILEIVNGMANGKYTKLTTARKNLGECALIVAGSEFDLYISHGTGVPYIVLDNKVYGLK